MDEARELDHHKEQLAETVLAAYREEYEELYQVWKAIETKAQAGVAVAGIFIAGLFGFMRPSDAKYLVPVERVVIAVAVSVFLISLIFGAFALRVRRRTSPKTGRWVHQMANDIREVPDAELPRKMHTFILDQVSLWKAGVQEMEVAIQQKSRPLRVSHALLLVGILMVAVAALSSLFVKR